MNFFDILLAKKLEDDRDPRVEGLSVTANGRYEETGVVYTPVIVNVPYDFDKKSLTDQPVASFDDAMNAPLYDLDIDINPVQDLHGYDYPWVGGAGKNKLNGADVTTSNLSNWEIDWNESTNTLTITHKTSYTSGTPSLMLNLAVGTYVTSFASQTKTASISLYVNGVYTDVLRNGTTFSVESGNSYEVRFVADEGTSNVITKFQIESGSTATSYAPYSNICPISGWTAANVTACGETYNISFGAAGTVYGGTLDVTTGVLTVDRAEVDLSTLIWEWRNVNGVNRLCSNKINEMLTPNGDQFEPEIITSCYIPSSITDIGSGDGRIGIGNKIYSYGRMLVVNDSRIIDPTDAATILNGQTAVYQLETPQTYQITPEEIKTIFDQQNNIYADTGNVNNVTYLAVASE